MNDDIIYRLADGRAWSVQDACWLDESMAAALSGDSENAAPNSPADASIIDLVSTSGESDEAYLARTLEFYGFPPGELASLSPEGIKQQLAALDERFLTPRTLAGLATGDSEALARWNEHENAAAPLRARLAELGGEYLLASGACACPGKKKREGVF